jgi:hypothetical protein
MIEIPVRTENKDYLRGRVGRFSIDFHFLEYQPSRLLPLFAQIVVLDARARFSTNAIEYEALCEQFDRLEPGIMAPEYTLMVTQSVISENPLEYSYAYKWTRLP